MGPKAIPRAFACALPGLREPAVVTIPAALGLIALAEPISRLLFEHGEAVDADAVAIGRTLQGFAAGLVFFSAFQLLTRTFYAMQDTRTPALVNVGVGCVNIAAALLYTGPLDLGLRGLASRMRRRLSVPPSYRPRPAPAGPIAGPVASTTLPLRRGDRRPPRAVGVLGLEIPGYAAWSPRRSTSAWPSPLGCCVPDPALICESEVDA